MGGGSDLFLRTLIRPRCGAALVPAERALTDSSRRRRARRRLRGRCTRGRHWPICAVPGRSSGRGRTSFGWGYCAPTITGLFARTFNLPNIICAMCDRSRNLARLAAACVCRQIFGSPGGGRTFPAEFCALPGGGCTAVVKNPLGDSRGSILEAPELAYE